jgi:acid phosphatase (class A)
MENGMKRGLLALVCVVAAGLTAAAQTATDSGMGTAPTKAAAYALNPPVEGLTRLIAAPPKEGSAEQKAELAELHRIESTRTAEQVKAAKDDEQNENMFLYRSVFGPGFTADALPLTAALGARVKAEQSAAGGALKTEFARLRPYAADKTLHPACELTTKANSYPSGHALTGYLEGLTLAELVPERRDAILARADDYAHNRLECGVHYPSDIEASRRVAYVVFGEMLASPEFEQELAGARQEMRADRALQIR